MRETDITQFKIKIKNPEDNAKNKIKIFLKVLLRVVLTLGLICVCAGIVVSISVGMYLIELSQEEINVDLRARTMNLTSRIWVMNEKTGEYELERELYGSEDRKLVKNSEIPEAMKEAIVAIEDKRFDDHKGVDWWRTGGAVMGLVTGRDNYGGSTITQQLIKNLTDDDDVSLTRKLREIFRALNLEKKYTKEEILVAYLNTVNFGNNAQGVQAAAQLYFDKDIWDCSIAECAAIAGITQNPSKWNPLVYPENNKIRRDDIIEEMYSQGKIKEKEYNEAVKESAEMVFANAKKLDDDEDDEEEIDVQNWYIDTLCVQVVEHLKKTYNLSTAAAEMKLYNEGLNIYCAMDKEMQEYAEEVCNNIDRSNDSDLLIGLTMIDPKGRIICTASSTLDGEPKEGNLVFSCARSPQQPGSSIKPVVAYPYPIDKGDLNYSSSLELKRIEDYYGAGKDGPTNWDNNYSGSMLVPAAIERSVNTIPAKLIRDYIGTRTAYDQVVGKMGFEHLDAEEDSSIIGALSLGGMHGGVTTIEMAGAYEYLVNGGRFYEPYTYYYITDANEKIILDNRDAISKQAYSEETATIMNRLLHYNVENSYSTSAGRSKIGGWDIIGKTGSTDNDENVWFCGASPYAVMAVWTGLEEYETIHSPTVAVDSFKKVMSKYLEKKDHREYDLSDKVVKKAYCTITGDLSQNCYSTATGYYNPSFLPDYCNASHGGPPTTPPPQTDPPNEETVPPYEETEPPEEETEQDVIETDPLSETDPPEQTVA